MVDNSLGPSPYREPAPQKTEQIYSGRLKRTLRVFAFTASAFASYETFRIAEKAESELRTDASYLDIQKLEQARSEIRDAKSALDHLPMLVLPACNEDKNCIILVTPPINPNIERTESLLRHAVELADGHERVSVHLRSILFSLPNSATTSEEIDRCNQVRTELGSAVEELESELASARNSPNERTKFLISEKEVATGGTLLSVLALIFLMLPSQKPKEETEKPDSS